MIDLWSTLRPFRQELEVLTTRKSLKRIASVKDLDARPVFVVGPPRSGTTVLYQALTYSMEFCFFTNRMMAHPRLIPLLLKTSSCPLASESFDSDYGMTKGPNSPHEGWPFWRRFFPRGHHDYVEEHTLSEEECDEIRNTVGFLIDHYNRPFVSKNIETILRLRSLKAVFPKAVFVLVKRDPRSTASSILEGRTKLHKDRNTWFGMKPQNHAELAERSVPKQIAGQILAAYRVFFEDIGDSLFHELYYEDFCENPTKEVAKIREFLRGLGIPLDSTDRSLPESFKYKTKCLFEDKEYEELVETFRCDPLFDKHLRFRLNDVQSCLLQPIGSPEPDK